MPEDVKEILRRYEAKLAKQIRTEEIRSDWSKEYSRFKEETIPVLTKYEKLCKGIGNVIKIRLKKEDEERIGKALETAHLDIKPADVAAFSIFSFIGFILLSIMIILGIYLLTDTFSLLAVGLAVMIGLFIYYYTSTLPESIARRWRLKASSQMIPCVLYTVVFMRHTSNLELAVRFASEHLQNPLALDFKKIFWNVETGKFSTIKDSLDAYLENWREYSREFVESFHLIEGSLYEPSEERRIEILDKALTIILEGVHEKMLHYSHDIHAPLTNLYMLGIVLPTLGIALLPLASTLLGGAIKWPHVLLLFNVLIPFFVFYLTSKILVTRPGGYGETELLEQNPNYKYYISKQPYYIAALLAIPLFIIGLLPVLFQFTALPELIGLEKDYTFAQLGMPFFGEAKIFDFKDGAGPFGLLALLLSLCIPLSIALFFALSYKIKTERLIEVRKRTKGLETEFASSIFQLGNRLADGVPAEMAFGRVAESLRGTPTGKFFALVNSNIAQFGMSVNEAIFNPQRGAIIEFPSSLIRTSMRILIESVKKGLQVAATALMSISTYVKNIHSSNERLRDLLAETVSGMRSNMGFLAPVLAGIVVGLAAMITTILNKLQTMLAGGQIGSETMLGGLGSAGALTKMFDVTKMIPPYFLQIIIGIYLVEIIYILTTTLVTVESGTDRLKEKAEIAGNMRLGIIFYLIVALFAILALSFLAALAIGGLAM